MDYLFNSARSRLHLVSAGAYARVISIGEDARIYGHGKVASVRPSAAPTIEGIPLKSKLSPRRDKNA